MENTLLETMTDLAREAETAFSGPGALAARTIVTQALDAARSNVAVAHSPNTDPAEGAVLLSVTADGIIDAAMRATVRLSHMGTVTVDGYHNRLMAAAGGVRKAGWVLEGIRVADYA